MCPDVGHLVELDIAALVEDVSVDVLPPEQPDVTVVSDAALRLLGHVEVGTLCLCFHRTRHVRHAKQLQ